MGECNANDERYKGRFEEVLRINWSHIVFVLLLPSHYSIASKRKY